MSKSEKENIFLIEWNIPLSTGSGDTLQIKIAESDRLFIVGANGSGKSALVHHFVKSNSQARVRRVSAHRKSWFSSSTLDLTAQARRSLEGNVKSYDSKTESRWMEHDSERRLSAVIFDLVASENQRARSIAGHVDKNEMKEAAAKSTKSKSPFEQINELLALGTLTVTLENSKDEEILARHRNGDSFSMAQLSDGERNAIIIAATVLTVEPGTVLLIDEPERHLHRAIIEPFLSALFERRTDCPFVVSTHEIALPAANPEARVLMPRSCEWNGDTPIAWDIQMLEPNADLPEELRLSILGSRRRILFVEGKLDSLDLPLYSALFPGLSVLPKEGCVGVQRAVAGLRSAYNHHHVDAYGLVDRDDRSKEQVRDLAKNGVFALEVYSAEALYYSSSAVNAVARRQAESLGCDADEMAESALSSGIGALGEPGVPERMAARRCERKLRESILSQVPDWEMIRDNGGVEIKLSVASPFSEELAQFNSLAISKKWNDLVARYPLRQSKAFDRIVRELDCASRNKYEQMVLTRIQADEALADELREKIGSLSRTLRDEATQEVQLD